MYGLKKASRKLCNYFFLRLMQTCQFVILNRVQELLSILCNKSIAQFGMTGLTKADEAYSV
jgi:hypothetical protein